MNIVMGIIGYGVVGTAMENQFRDRVDFLISDPRYENSVSLEDLYRKCQFIFVCVPTPMKSVEGGEINCTILDSVMKSLHEISLEHTTHPVICIKSTVIPSKLKEYEDNYTNLRLTMSPEYLTEANSMEDAINLKSLVIGGAKEDTQAIVDLYENYSHCRKPYPVGQVDLIASGVLKYMENCYLAMKVSFMNQFYDVLQASGSKDEWMHVAEVFHLDTRMGNSHYQVPGPDGDRGWGGKCLPKDVNALIYYAKDLGVDVDLMEKCWEINQRIRKDIDWARIDGAVSDDEGTK